jgi:hypothetical protein
MDQCIGPFGDEGDLPVKGNWSGTVSPRIGVFRRTDSNGIWTLTATESSIIAQKIAALARLVTPMTFR